MEKNENKSIRNYNLDLLRIIAMLMIVILHYTGHGCQLKTVGTAAYNTPILWLIHAFCVVGVNIFVLISGYFLCDSTFKWKKVFKLWSTTIFYTVSIYLLFRIFYNFKYDSISGILQIVFPVITGAYWFITEYIILYIFSPYLNIVIKNLSQKDYKKMLIITGVMILVLNRIIPIYSFIDGSSGQSIIWFIYLYFLAAYIKKYDFKKLEVIHYLTIYIVASLTTFFSRYFILKYLSSSDIFKNRELILWNNNSMTIFVASVALFMFFKNIKLKPILEKLITKISACTVGVYLIHDNNIVRQYLYTTFLKVPYFIKQNFLIKSTAMLASILGIFIVCTIIEYIRQIIFKKLKL